MITSDNTFTLLKKYNQDPFHIQHALTVETVIKLYVNELGYIWKFTVSPQYTRSDRICWFVNDARQIKSKNLT